MRIELPESIRTERVIPVARRLDADRAVRLVESLMVGGLSTLEITVEASGGLDSIKAVAESGATIGAGTVTSIRQAVGAVEAGAAFVVSPHLDIEVVEWARRQAVPYIPGAFTPTEVWAAWSRKPAAVKVFPASTGGAGHIRSLLGPYPDAVLVPTGGIDASNAAGFLAAGAVAVGVGTWLTGGADWGLVSERAAELREVV